MIMLNNIIREIRSHATQYMITEKILFFFFNFMIE